MAESLLDTYLNCPVCLDIVTEPVTLGCHHSFCCSCLKDYWDQNNTKNCPVCRRKSSKDNTKVNFALNELSLQFREKQKKTVQTEEEKESPTHTQTEKHGICDKHPEVPPLFCKDEGRALCPVCEFFQHQRHTVVRVEEVQEELKKQIKSELETLIKQRDKYKNLERTFKHITKHTETQAEQCVCQIRALFSRLHQFLTNEETRALEALREEQQRQAHTMSPQLGRITEELASMETTIQELNELLKRDTVLHYSPQRPLLTEPEPALGPGLLLDQAKVVGNLGFRVWRGMRREVSYSPVILDPNTAFPYLHLSEDLRGVTCGDTEYQKVPLNPERFINSTYVMGSEGFMSGTHQWDVKVGDHPQWAMGVVKETIKRNERWVGTPVGGVWTLEHLRGTYLDVFFKSLTLQRRPEKIRVLLDYDRGQLTFTDADHMNQIYTYTGMFRERVFPFFYIEYAGEAKTKEIRICLSDGPAEKV